MATKTKRMIPDRIIVVEARLFRLGRPVQVYLRYPTGRARRLARKFVTALKAWTRKIAASPISTGTTRGLEIRRWEYSLNAGGPKKTSRFPARWSTR
jgi:hypothetical protein